MKNSIVNSTLRHVRLACLAILTGVVIATGAMLLAQPTSAPQPPAKKPTTMKTYVMIFHPNPKNFSEQELKTRDHEIRAWAQQQLDSNSHLDPRIVDKQSVSIAMNGDGKEVVSESTPPVAALLFIEAENRDAAIKIAKSHPGVRYGSTIDLCEWQDPRNAPR